MFRVFLFGSLLALNSISRAQTIPQVQGHTDISPFDKKTLTLEGIVTGVFGGNERLGGFFLQDAHGDGDETTSDGIFIFQNPRSAGAQVAVENGQKIRVLGRVSERFGQTQLNAVRIEIIDDKLQPLMPTPISLPLAKGENFERFEGMLVRFEKPLFVSSSSELLINGTLTLSSRRLFNPTNQAPLAQTKLSELTDRLILDDGSNARYPKTTAYFDANKTRRAGTLVSDLQGVIGYSYDRFRLQPTQPVQFIDANPRPIWAPQIGGNLKIASANLHNFWTTLKSKTNEARGAESAPQFERQKRKTIAMLRGLDADIVALQEIENNGEVAIGALVDSLNTAYGAPVYDFVRDPQTGAGDDAIKVGLIFKPARVAPVSQSLSDPSPIFDRKPVAQTFCDLRSSAVFSVVVNHFKSKGSAPATGDIDLGEGAWNKKRLQQAHTLLKFIERIAILSGDPDILVMGDFNAYIHESPLIALRAKGLKHLNLRLAPEERYSFSFNELFGSLDHAFATPAMDAQIRGIGEWRINADEPFFLIYNRAKISEFQDNPFRASDHDPLLVGVELK